VARTLFVAEPQRAAGDRERCLRVCRQIDAKIALQRQRLPAEFDGVTAGLAARDQAADAAVAGQAAHVRRVAFKND